MKDKIIKLFSNTKLTISKHSPEILLIAGVAGTVASTVIACKQTLKINDILEEKNKKIEDIKECVSDDNIEYDQNDANKDTTLVYVQTGAKILQLYSPAIILGSLSIASIFTGHNILKKRNIALAAAYAVVDTSFKKYRENVIAEYGQGVDQAMRFGLKTKETKKKNKETGKTETITEIEAVENPLDEYSTYARYFDASCECWTKDAEYNLLFLRKQQDFANEKLKSQGYLFLNEVYDMLDIPRTKAGQIVGWIYNPETNESGDNYIDFGIYKNNESNRLFVNGTERNILLDFNVDGPIYNILDDAYIMAHSK